MKRLIIVAALSVAACSSPAPVEQDEDGIVMAQPIEPAAPSAPAPDQAAIEAAKAAISAEPKVKDVRYDGGDTVQWHVGVLDDGTERSGFAVYICQLIEEKGATTGRTHVRIVDAGKVAAGSDFRAASLGHVICETGDVVDP